MSVPGTPSRQDGNSKGNDSEDPLRTVKATRTGTLAGGADSEEQNSESPNPASPFSFKKRGVPERSNSGTDSPVQSSKRSLSNIFNRRPSGAAAAGRSNAPGQLNMPSQPSFPGSDNAQSTPTAGRRVSTATRGGSRRASLANRGIHQTLAPGTPPGPGALGRRISDWQEAASQSPLEPPLSPGGGPAGDDTLDDEEEEQLPLEPIIPQMLPGLKTPEYQTPLPKIATIVLCICMVGEFLSASVGAPFLLPMLEDLGVPGGGGESAVGLWAGIVSAAFFLTQFATALLWASASVRFGRRAVLFTSLLGNTLMLLLYGTCKSVWLMVVIRLFQGAFNGAVGVARSAVKDITDSTNESRAYSVMGLCWSLGGIIGPILGGWLEHPVEHIPSLFANSKLFNTYPYLLPTSIAASVTATGCVFTLFLSYDGGPREGAIRLPEEKDVERAVNTVASLPGSVKKKLSGYFASPSSPNNRNNVNEATSPLPISERGSTFLNPSHQHLATSSGHDLHHRKSRTSFAVGSAYGYDPIGGGVRRRETAASRFRKMSTATSTRYAPDYEGEEEDLPPLNFAQKLLFANGEASTFNITDVWIAAATRDEADPYTSAALDEDPFADEDESAILGEDDILEEEDEDEDAEELASQSARDPFTDAGASGNHAATASGMSGVGRAVSRLRHDSMATGTTSVRQASPLRQAALAAGVTGLGGTRLRSQSIMSSTARPALYQNTGLAKSPVTSPAIRRDSIHTQYFDQQPSSPSAAGPAQYQQQQQQQQQQSLAAIPEGKSSSGGGLLMVPGQSEATVRQTTSVPAAIIEEKETLQQFSMMRDLPMTLIAQYTLLALHGTIMDQVFMSYLVSKTYAGGLGLEASDFADIIACMCIFQMLFQFRFYPAVSLPLGRLTHLQMFRLGLFLYLIPYIFFPELRPLLTPGVGQNKVVTFGLILLTATRYLANTCAYTAVMILINATTSPLHVPLANGLAQSAVSLARFIGPLTGGVIWSSSIKTDPDGYYIGFAVCACICFLGLCHSFVIR